MREDTAILILFMILTILSVFAIAGVYLLDKKRREDFIDLKATANDLDRALLNHDWAINTLHDILNKCEHVWDENEKVCLRCNATKLLIEDLRKPSDPPIK